MKILAFDLSSARGSLAWHQAASAFERHWPNNRKDSAAFFENLADVRRKFGLADLIIVGLGPGSYTGTRIAISAAIGLQTASGAKLIGWPSICAFETDEKEYCVIGDARRNSFFFARIRTNDLIEGPHLFSETELRKQLNGLVGRIPIFASENIPQFKEAELRHPSANVLARVGSETSREFARPPLEPIYLREAHITNPKAT